MIIDLPDGSTTRIRNGYIDTASAAAATGFWSSILMAPMVEWDKRRGRLSRTQQKALADEAYALAIRAARLGAFVGALIDGRSPEEAQKAQNLIAKKVRRTFGFTYPGDKITF